VDLAYLAQQGEHQRYASRTITPLFCSLFVDGAYPLMKVGLRTLSSPRGTCRVTVVAVSYVSSTGRRKSARLWFGRKKAGKGGGICVVEKEKGNVRKKQHTIVMEKRKVSFRTGSTFFLAVRMQSEVCRRFYRLVFGR